MVAMAIVRTEDVQIYFGNVKLLLPRWSAHRENGESLIFKTPANLTHKPIWKQKEKPLRDGALTKEEFFVLEELIKLFHERGKELSSTSLLAYYNFIHSTICTLDPKPLLLRPKTHEQIKRAIAAYNHDASIMAALFNKQVELCYSKT